MATRILIGSLVLILAVATLAPATPLACSACDVTGDEIFGYRPPATEVSDGGSITWATGDITHVQEDFGRGDPCFATISQPGSPSTADFRVVDGKLYATSALGTDVECVNAVKLPYGSFLLPYYCTIHPVMRGFIVVTP